MQMRTDASSGATGDELDAFLQRRQDSCVPEHERADVVRKRWPTGTDAEQFTRGRMPEYVPVEPRVNGVRHSIEPRSAVSDQVVGPNWPDEHNVRVDKQNEPSSYRPREVQLEQLLHNPPPDGRERTP
jgi:hypothetical protein